MRPGYLWQRRGRPRQNPVHTPRQGPELDGQEIVEADSKYANAALLSSATYEIQGNPELQPALGSWKSSAHELPDTGATPRGDT
jgi:hypothetical protein